MSYREFKNDNDILLRVWKNEAGAFHRESGPALIRHYPDGSIELESFYASGALHRESGPAVIRYYPDVSIEWENFYVAGAIHRESGPALIYYYPDGSIKLESFYVSGKFLGYDKVGFWAFWGKLNEVERQAPSILRCLTRYS